MRTMYLHWHTSISNNEGHDQFIWDRDAGLPAEYGVVVCEEKLRQKDPEGIYETLSGYQDTTYFHDGPFLYRYTPKTGQPYYYIEQWDLNNILSINQDRIICYDRDRSRYVIMNDNIAGTATYLDIMPDEQLKEWFVETYVKKHGVPSCRTRIGTNYYRRSRIRFQPKVSQMRFWSLVSRVYL